MRSRFYFKRNIVLVKDPLAIIRDLEYNKNKIVFDELYKKYNIKYYNGLIGE